MRTLVLLALALAATGLAHAQATHLVDVVNNSYVDAATGTPVTRIGAGDTVKWIWRAGAHSVTEGVNALAGRGSFDSATLETEAGPTFSVTFHEAGRYAYYCKVHASMRGLVLVE